MGGSWYLQNSQSSCLTLRCRFNGKWQKSGTARLMSHLKLLSGNRVTRINTGFTVAFARSNCSLKLTILTCGKTRSLRASSQNPDVIQSLVTCFSARVTDVRSV